VTARSDFTLEELRGAGGKPASLYIVVPQNDMAAFAPVTGMLVEMASMALLSKRPEKDESQVLFVLDEARASFRHSMPSPTAPRSAVAMACTISSAPRIT